MSGSGRRRYWSTALDRALADTRVVAVVGPVEGLNVDQVRADLRRLVFSGAQGRLGLEADPHARRWRRKPETVAEAVTELPLYETAADLLTAVRRFPGRKRPLEVYVSGEYLVVDNSHGLGDGQLTLLTLLALIRGEGHPDLSTVLAPLLPASATWAGLWRAVGKQPGRLRSVLRLRGEHAGASAPATGAPAAGDADVTAAPVGWATSQRLLIASMQVNQIARLDEWGREHAPGASAAMLSSALCSAALREQGIECAEQQLVLIDCRRYLPKEQRGGQGNFAVGIPLKFGVAGPELRSDTVREVTASGWPMVTLAIGEVKGLFAAFRPRRESFTTPREIGSKVRLAVSDMGKPRVAETVAWATDGGQRVIIPYIDPDGPDAMTVCVLEAGGARTISASFHDLVIDAQRVQAALDRAVADPVGVLEGTGA